MFGLNKTKKRGQGDPFFSLNAELDTTGWDPPYVGRRLRLFGTPRWAGAEVWKGRTGFGGAAVVEDGGSALLGQLPAVFPVLPAVADDAVELPGAGVPRTWLWDHPELKRASLAGSGLAPGTRALLRQVPDDDHAHVAGGAGDGEDENRGPAATQLSRNPPVSPLCPGDHVAELSTAWAVQAPSRPRG